MDSSSSTRTPIKPTPSPPSDQISTPEKPIDGPRFSRGRGVAYSLKQVKNAALGLRSPTKAPDRNDPSHDSSLPSPSGPDPKPSRSKPPAVKLPEKFEVLGQFFKCLETSIRLLKLKGQKCSFSNVCPKIEFLTDRRFEYGHLAQMKHVLPEAILVKKILTCDEKTCCMKPDLQISLVADAFQENAKLRSGNGYSLLAKVFRIRLEEFCDEHPEVDDIPGDPLPEPFNRTKSSKPITKNEDTHTASTSSLPNEPTNTVSTNQFAVLSHLSVSFKRRFSQNSVLPSRHALTSLKTESRDKCASKPSMGLLTTLLPSANQMEKGKETLSDDCPPKPTTRSQTSPLTSAIQLEKGKETTSDDCPPKSGADALSGTPLRAASTPAQLMADTPDLKTPKRCSTSNEDLTPVKKRVRRPLSLTPVKSTQGKDDETETDTDEVDEPSLKFLPKSLLQSVRERERKALEDKEAGLPQMKRRQQMIACLPKLFDIIILIFQSAKRSVLTKQELVNKIIASHFDIIDKSEVEEQLCLLQGLLPEWISGKTILSGDFVLRVDRKASPELMRQRLAEAE